MDGLAAAVTCAAKAEQVVEVEPEAARPAVRPLGPVTRTARALPLACSAACSAVSRAASVARATLRPGCRPGATVARRVLLGVDDAVVRLVDLVHAIRRRRIVRVQIGMVLASLLAVRLLHLVGGRITAHAQHVVGILNHGASPYRFPTRSTSATRPRTPRCAAGAGRAPAASARTPRPRPPPAGADPRAYPPRSYP